MGESNNIAAIIFGIGSLQGFLVSINLFVLKRGNQRANRILAILVLALALIIFQNFIGASGLYTYLPHLIFLFYPLNGLIGPLFFLYVTVLLFPQKRLHPLELLHLIGFVLLIALHWGYLWAPAYAKILFAEYIYFSERVIPENSVYSIIGLRLYTMTYALLALITISKRIRILKQQHAISNISYLNRFKYIALLFAGYALLSMCVTVFGFQAQLKLGLFEIYGHVVNSSFLLLMAIITIHFPKHLFFVLKERARKANGLLTNPAITFPDELFKFMREKKLFLNPDLKLHDLATQLQMAPHTLSEKINQELHMNFYDFVNQYRIEEFKDRALSPENSHLTLLALAYDVGFNSKASFNRIFKKNTGQTPSQYLKQKQVSTSETESI